MARKKPGNKNQQKTTWQALETEWKQIPSKLTAQATTELATLKNKETQIKNQIAKTKTQLQTARARLANATSNKSKAGKKLYAQAQKASKIATSTLATLNKQLLDNLKQADTLKIKQTRITSLRKHLTTFEKTWSKEAKKLLQTLAAKTKATIAAQTKVAAPAKAKTKTKPKTKKTSTSPSTNTQPQQQVETYNNSLDNTRFQNTTEAETA